MTGTGLAQPNRKGDCISSRAAGTRMVPIKSICAKGLSVSLPRFFRRIVAPIAGGVGVGGFVKGNGQQQGGDGQEEGG